MLKVKDGRMYALHEYLPTLDYGPVATPEQVARFVRHVNAGTTPGDPPWYKFPKVKEFKFKPGAKPVYAKGLDELRIEDSDE
jgi:hypothetical protein